MPGAQERWFWPLLASHCAGRGERGGDDHTAGGGGTAKPEEKSRPILARQERRRGHGT